MERKVDFADRYGGTVSLEGPGLEAVKEGQRLRVAGRLTPPEERLGVAQFHVRSIEFIDP